MAHLKETYTFMDFSYTTLDQAWANIYRPIYYLLLMSRLLSVPHIAIRSRTPADREESGSRHKWIHDQRYDSFRITSVSIKINLYFYYSQVRTYISPSISLSPHYSTHPAAITITIANRKERFHHNKRKQCPPHNRKQQQRTSKPDREQKKNETIKERPCISRSSKTAKTQMFYKTIRRHFRSPSPPGWPRTLPPPYRSCPCR